MLHVLFMCFILYVADIFISSNISCLAPFSDSLFPHPSQFAERQSSVETLPEGWKWHHEVGNATTRLEMSPFPPSSASPRTVKDGGTGRWRMEWGSWEIINIENISKRQPFDHRACLRKDLSSAWGCLHTPAILLAFTACHSIWFCL